MSPPASHRHHIPLAVTYALLTSVVASTAAAAAKLISNEVSPWQVVWIQYAICTAVMLPWLLRQGIGSLKTARPGLHLVRSLGGWAGFTAYYLAIPQIPLVDAALLRSAAPLWVPLVVFVWLSAAIPPRRWLALVTGFAGICLILRPQGGALNPGHLFGLLAGLGLAVSMATTRTLSATEPANRVLFYYFGLSFIACIPMAASHWQPIPLSSWPALLWIGLSIYITMVLYTRAYSHGPTSLVAPLSYMAVPCAAVLDWLLWGHLPALWTLVGSAVVIAAGVIAVTARGPEQGDH